MQPTDNPYLLIPAILLSIFIIGVSVKYTLKVIVSDYQPTLARVAIATFAVVTTVWTLDKIGFVNRHILTEYESNRLFDVMFAMFMTYLASKKNEDKKDKL